MEKAVNHEQREYVAAAVNYFWNGLAKPHTVNENAAKVIYKALTEVQSCTASIDLVPRPTYTASISYIVKEVAKVEKRIVSGNTSAYHMCRDRVAVNYRTFMEAALMEL